MQNNFGIAVEILFLLIDILIDVPHIYQQITNSNIAVQILFYKYQ